MKRPPPATRAETYASIKALLGTLGDPFTRFLDPDQYAALRRTTTGALTGVGVEVSFDARGHLVVVAPSSGGPAERAGVKPGDEILEIDGTSTRDLSLYAVGERATGVHFVLAISYFSTCFLSFFLSLVTISLPLPSQHAQHRPF